MMDFERTWIIYWYNDGFERTWIIWTCANTLSIGSAKKTTKAILVKLGQLCNHSHLSI